MIRALNILAILVVAAVMWSHAAAQSVIRLVARKGSEVELVYGKRSVIFDLDQSLSGTNGSLPGEPPHKI